VAGTETYAACESLSGTDEDRPEFVETQDDDIIIFSRDRLVFVDLATKQEAFGGKLPPELTITTDGQTIVAFNGKSAFELTPQSRPNRVPMWARRGFYEEALKMITSGDGFPELDVIVTAYSNMSDCNIDVLMTALERVGRQMMVPERLKEPGLTRMLVAILEGKYPSWKCTFPLVEALLEMDAVRAEEWLLNVIAEPEWRLRALAAALKKERFKLASHFAMGDLHLSLLLAYHAGAWETIVHLLTNVLTGEEYSAAAPFFIFANLAEFVTNHPESASVVVKAALNPPSFTPEVGQVFSSVLSWMTYDSPLWILVAESMTSLGLLLRLNQNDFARFEEFIFQENQYNQEEENNSEDELNKARVDLLNWAVRTKQHPELQERRWITLFTDCDFGSRWTSDAIKAIGPLIKDPEDLLRILTISGGTNFREAVERLPKTFSMRDTLQQYAHRWMEINANEFVDLVVKLDDSRFVSSSTTIFNHVISAAVRKRFNGMSSPFSSTRPDLLNPRIKTFVGSTSNSPVNTHRTGSVALSHS
jgi:hypothetical protein